MIKLELQTGSSSIKLEGEVDDVERILAAYWPPSSTDEQLENGTGNGHEVSASSSRATTKRKGKRGPETASAESMQSRPYVLDAEQVANDIKAHVSFGQFKSKVLDAKGDWISKCKLVALVANVPITSGDVARVLTVLRVRASLPRLSEALSGNSTDFLTKGVNPVRYTMTSVAEEAFKTWLVEPAKTAA